MPDLVVTGTDTPPNTPGPQGQPAAGDPSAQAAPDTSQYDLGPAVTSGQQPGSSGGEGTPGTSGDTPAQPVDTSQYDLGGTVQPGKDPDDPGTGLTGLAHTAGETSGIPAALGAVGAQIKHTVTTPNEYYKQAVDAYRRGDIKAGLEATTQLNTALATFGMADKNSPMRAMVKMLFQHPIDELKAQRDQDRKNGIAAPSSFTDAVKGIPDAIKQDVGAPIAKAKADWEAGNGAGAVADIVADPLQSHAVGAIPFVGPALQQEGHNINRDMHSHNFGAFAGDVLGPLITAGLGKALGGLGAAADESAEGIQASRPGTANISGVDVPVSKTNPTMGTPSRSTRIWQSFSSKDGAADFVKAQSAPAVDATHATLNEGALSAIDDLRKMRGEAPTGYAAPHLEDLDETVKFMRQEAQKTYQQLDQAALNDVSNWEQKYGPNSGYSPKAKQPSVPPRPKQTSANANTYAQDQIDWDAKHGATYKPDGTVKSPLPDVPAPPKPKKFSDLQTELDEAQTMANSKVASAADRAAARADLPALQKEMTDFLQRYGRSVKPNELEAANNLWKQHLRMEWIADQIRTGVKGTQAGNFTAATAPKVTAQWLESLPNKFDNKFGTILKPNAFEDLLGPEGTKNFHDITNVMQESKVGQTPFFSWLNNLSIKGVKLLPTSQLADSVLFNPRAGSAAVNLYKLARTTGALEKGAGAVTKTAPIAGPQAATKPVDPNIGRHVTVDGVPGTQIGTHPVSGKPVVVYHKDQK